MLAAGKYAEYWISGMAEMDASFTHSKEASVKIFDDETAQVCEMLDSSQYRAYRSDQTLGYLGRHLGL